MTLSGNRFYIIINIKGMRLEHYPEQKLKMQILDIIKKYLDIGQYRVFIFGSRVSGTGTERSDIDIGIMGPKPIPGEVRVEILEDMENLPTLYRFDLVDFTGVPPEFRREALRNAEYVN